MPYALSGAVRLQESGMWTHLIVAGVLAVTSVLPAFAQSSPYPNKLIRWVVPFAPGGGTDVIARPIMLGTLGTRVSETACRR